MSKPIITILNRKDVAIAPEMGITAVEVQIKQGFEKYRLPIGGIPVGMSDSELQIYLDARVDEYWTCATQHNIPDIPSQDEKIEAIKIVLETLLEV